MEKNKYILVIDNGLTVIKAAVLDLDGRIIGFHSELNSTIEDGCFSEIDMGLLWNKTVSVIKQAIVKSKIKPPDIYAVSNTGFGGGIFLVDEDGQAIRNAITSMDSRAADFVSESQIEGNIFFEKTKINMWNGQAIPLLHWLKKNKKNDFYNFHKILQVKDWIKFKLTGSYSTDYTDAGNTGLVNSSTQNYDHDLYKYYGLEEIFEMLPPLKKCKEITGYVNQETAAITGLSVDTPVMGGLVDVVACALGSGLHKEDKYSIISGTWNINTAVGKNIVKNKDIMACYLYADSKKYFVMDASPTSAVNLEWFLKSVLEKINIQNFERKDIYKKMDEEIPKKLKKNSQLLYFPFIYKSKLVNNIMGSFIGINSSDDVFDLIYSIYQGVAFAHLMHLKNLNKGGVIRKCAVLSGGASNSQLWCQVFADVLNLKVQTVSVKEVGLIGIAIPVLMGLEDISLENAINRMVKIKSVFKPNKEMNRLYMERFQRFKNIIKLLDSA